MKMHLKLVILMRYFDLHCDTITEICRKKTELSDYSGHLSIEKTKGIRLWRQCFAIFIPDDQRGDAAISYYERHYHYFKKQMMVNSDEISWQRSLSEITGDQTATKAAILTVEGGCVLAGDLNRVQQLSEDGVRMITLTWNGENELGCGISSNKGLTSFGFQAVQEMEQQDIVVDVSHLSDAGLDDVINCTTRPFMASHSSSRALCDHPRNLTDMQFGALAKKRCLVGINFSRGFLNRDSQKASYRDMIKHIDHFLGLGGEDVVALGSDFDGTDMPADFPDITAIPRLYEEMLRLGYPEKLVDKIFYQNAADFFVRYEQSKKQ